MVFYSLSDFSSSARNTSHSYHDSQSNGLCRESSMGLKHSPMAFQGLTAWHYVCC
jgi:hypothetical protein